MKALNNKESAELDHIHKDIQRNRASFKRTVRGIKLLTRKVGTQTEKHFPTVAPQGSWF